MTGLSDLQSKLDEKVEELFPKLIEVRRTLHMYPELSNMEFETTKRINQWLLEAGIQPMAANLATGTAAEITGALDGPTVAIRADIDALPIQEEADFPFRSKIDGVSHMCGHDVHTTIALGAAMILNDLRDQLPGNVRVLFQPAEETEGGATSMIAAGLMDGVKSIIGLHNSPDIPTGKMGVREGFMMASVDDFTLTIKGRGGHSARPHNTIDPIMIGTAVITQLQTIISRNVAAEQSAVLSFGAFQAGATHNVIPEIAVLKGTVRTSNDEVRQDIYERFIKIVTNTVEALGGEVEIDYQFLIPAVVNDADITEIVRRSAVTVVGEENTLRPEPSMGGEDFSYFQKEVPGCYVWLGSRNEENGIVYGLHHPKFMVDEEAIKIGVKWMVQSAFDLLKA